MDVNSKSVCMDQTWMGCYCEIDTPKGFELTIENGYGRNNYDSLVASRPLGRRCGKRERNKKERTDFTSQAVDLSLMTNSLYYVLRNPSASYKLFGVAITLGDRMLDRLLPNPYPPEYILGVGTVLAFSASEGLLPGMVLKLVRFQNCSPSSHTLEALSAHSAVFSGKGIGDEASFSEATSSTDGGTSNPASAPSSLRSISDISTSSNALAGPASSSSPLSAPPRASHPAVVSKSKSNMSLQLSLASGDPIHGSSGAGSRDRPWR